MTDSLDSMGSYELFPLDINWAKRPRLDFAFAKLLMKHIGTSVILETFTDDVPERINFGVTVYTKSDEYDLIDFFASRKGQHGKFWIKGPVREFTLKENALSGSSAILVYRNGAATQYQGYERIFIMMNDEDMLTRKISSITNDEMNDRYSLNLATPIDRDIDTDSHYIIARLYLVRFTEDKLFFSFKTDAVSEVEMTVRELVKEYATV